MQWTEKYRPVNIKDIVGHEYTKKVITGILKRGDIPHFLFYGHSPGTGKTSMAYAVARAILGGDLNGNFSEMNASDDRSLTSIRTHIIEAIKYMPLNGRVKIILLEEADGLNKEAQEALRHPLEKSGKTLFIFTSNHVNGWIKPLKSRLMDFEFEPLDFKDISARLEKIAKKERVADRVSLAQIINIAKESEGDMRTAINKLQKTAMVSPKIKRRPYTRQ